MPNQRKAASINTFCQEWDIGRTKTYELIKTGLIKTIKIGRKRLILYDGIEEALSDAFSGESK